MDAHLIKSVTVCKNNGIFIIHIGISHYDLGIQVHNWGIRIMLIWWHLCIHVKD